jgi:hypothetical protein
MASKLVGAVVGTFKVGSGVKVGQLVFQPDKPKLTLRGGAYKITIVADLKQVTPGKPKLTLRGKQVDATGTVFLSFNKARMTLRGKTFRPVEPTKVELPARPQLQLRGKHYNIVLTVSVGIGKPKLILRGKQIRRVGKAGLIPTIPTAELLSPTVAKSAILTPSYEEQVILTPTPQVYV